MARRFPNPSFFLTRGFLGVCVGMGGLLTLNAISRVLRDAPVTREVSLLSGRRRSLVVFDPPLGLSLLDAAPVLLAGVVALVAGLLVFRVVLGIQAARPFEARSAGRLRIAAVLIAVAAVAHPVLSAWADLAVAEHRGRESRGFSTELIWSIGAQTTWLLVAALLMVFAQAFSEGRRLADDTAGLV